MKRGAKLSSGLVLAATMAIAFHQASASPPVHRFLQYFQAVEKTNAPNTFWERVVCSFLLAKAEARQAKLPVS